MKRHRASTGAAACIGVIAFLCASAPVAAEDRAPNPARIMTYEEFSRAGSNAPLLLEYSTGQGRLLLVGVRHSLDTNSDTIAGIWNEWQRFQPTLAFFEGTDWTTGFSQSVVRQYGEPAVVRFLALASRVPSTSLEPDLVDEIDHLRKTWNDEQIKLFYVLRFVAERSGYGGSPPTEAEVGEFLGGAFPPTISGPPLTLQELESSYRKFCPAGTQWQAVPLEWFDPVSRTLFTNDIAAVSGRYRDEYMLPRFVERARQGDRVFVAVGGNHAHMLEPALTDALGPPVSKKAGP